MPDRFMQNVFGPNPYSPQFLGMAQQPGTLYQGYPSNYNMLDFSGMPGMNGPMGGLMQMFLQPLLGNMAAQSGYVPFQFNPVGGAFSNLQNINQFQQRFKAMDVASKADANNIFEAMQGFARMTGMRLQQSQLDSLQAVSADMSKALPFFGSMFPDLVDQISGPRGSNTVMAHYMHMGMRYGRDPLTGAVGGPLGQTAGDISTGVYNQLFSGDLSLTRTRGMGAGRVGQLYDELSRRGFMGGFQTIDERDASIKAAAGGRAGTPDDLLRDPKVRETLTKQEADRISGRLSGPLLGAVNAVREIFGDMGKPNAPMSEIVNALQAITQGGLATMQPAQLEETVRRVKSLAKNSGLTLDAVLQVQAAGAGIADRFGLNRSLATNLTANAAAAGQAYRGGTAPMLGQPSKDEMLVINQQLTARAMVSEQGGIFGALASLYASNQLDAGSDAARIAAAMKAGRFEYTDRQNVKRQIGPISQSDFVSLVGRAGVDKHHALTALTSFDYNQEVFDEFNIGGYIVGNPNFQYTDARDAIRKAGISALSDTRYDKLSLSQKSDVMDVFSKSLLGGLTQEQRSAADRSHTLATHAAKNMTPAQLALFGTDANQQQKALSVVADKFFRGLPATAQTMGLPTWPAMTQAFDEKSIQATNQARDAITIDTRLSAALSKFNQTPFIARLSGAMQQGQPGQGVNAVLLEALTGAKTTTQIENAILADPELKKLIQSGLSDINAMKFSNRNDPNWRTQLSQLGSRLESISPQISVRLNQIGAGTLGMIPPQPNVTATNVFGIVGGAATGGLGGAIMGAAAGAAGGTPTIGLGGTPTAATSTTGALGTPNAPSQVTPTQVLSLGDSIIKVLSDILDQLKLGKAPSSSGNISRKGAAAGQVP